MSRHSSRVPFRRAIASAAVAALLAAPTSVHAQSTTSPQCVTTPPLSAPPGPFFGRGAEACQKARDLFAFVTPQIGVAVSGGNPIPGDGGSLGGFGRRALSLRVVGVEGFLPRNDVPIGVDGASGDFGAARTIVPLPAIDGAIGLFAGVPLGLTNIGGVDLLLGVTVLPSVSRNSFELDPANGGLGFSYGLRVGALQESSVVPGLSVSWQRRELPKTDFRYRSGNDSLLVEGALVRSNAFRVVVSKRLALFGLAAGIGQDQIESTSNMSGVVNQELGTRTERYTISLAGLRETAKRNTAFVNASFSILVARIVGEYGWSSAGTIKNTVNSFGGRRANEGYRYGSLGISARF